MVEPDGYLEIDWYDDRPVEIINFKNIRSHSGTTNPSGLLIRYESHHKFIPWDSIDTLRVHYNSEAIEYGEFGTAADDFVMWVHKLQHNELLRRTITLEDIIARADEALEKQKG